MIFFTKISSISLAIFLVTFFRTHAQVSFASSNSKLQAATHSGCPMTVVDVNGDGLDDIVRLDEGHLVYIDYQRAGHLFTHDFIADFGYNSGWAWSMCVGDFDHNGFKDIVAGGSSSSPKKVLLIDSTGLSGTIINLPMSYFFIQNINIMDVNNDGWEDIFGCDDDAESHIWINDGEGGFSVSGIIDFDITTTDDSGNYGSVWTDFDNDGDVDLYIAKCRQFVFNENDGRRIDALFVNNGDNTFTSNAAGYGLADSSQTWTCNFGDIDNDGDLDAIQINYDVPVKLLENDGTGHMTPISGSGFILSSSSPIESVMEDFDNDGFVDILVTGSNYEFFHNNGNHTFTKLPGIFGNDHMESFAIGDLNHDGKIDVYGGYAGLYTNPSNTDDVYWENNTVNGNHFITFNLIGTSSTPGAYGGRVTLYGSWGKQVREVHAGESYGTCNSSNLHFGLGASVSIDSAVIHWPSGINTTIPGPVIDQFITVKENICTSPDFTVSASGPLAFCPGEQVTLTASALPAGYTYLWSDSSTSQSLTIDTSGEYYVTAVSENNDCSVTAAAVVTRLSPDETPTIQVTGDLTFCEGGSVLLSSPQAASYSWSNGEIQQSISVTESGSYSVTIQGICQQWSSAPVLVDVLASPPPTTTGANIGEPGLATVTATGNIISWYDVPSGGSPVATGNAYTSYAATTDTFYAEDQQVYNDDTLYTGQTFHSGSSLYSSSGTTNSTIIFDVLNSCVLRSVKVYTDVPGDRLFELMDNNGNVVQSTMINVPVDSSRVTLNFNLITGNNYELGTNKDQNQILLGTDGPRLQRSNGGGVNYPYVIEDVVSLNNSPFGLDYYYYFYDWEVIPPSTTCVSARTPAIVYLSTGIRSVTEASFQLFPNPSAGQVTILSNGMIESKVNIEVTAVTGKVLLSRNEEGMKPGQHILFDLAQFSRGVYYITIKNESETFQNKVVIQ